MKSTKIKTACQHAAQLLIALSVCVIGASALAQDWYWIGGVSPNWSDLGNWNKAEDGSGAAPADVDALRDKQLFLNTNGAFSPTNQDIDNLAVGELDFCKTNFLQMVSGKPIQLNNRVLAFGAGWTVAGFRVEIHNDLAINSASEWGTGGGNGVFHLYGKVSGVGANQTIAAGGDGGLYFYAPVNLENGFRFNSAKAHFYGMDTIGAPPQEFSAGYFSAGSSGMVFHSPSGNFFEYMLDEKMGVTLLGDNAGFEVDQNVTVQVNADIKSADASNRMRKQNHGTLVINKENALQTGVDVINGHVVLNASQTAEDPNVSAILSGTAFDFNGQDFIGFDIIFAGDGGFDDSGLFRNSNPARESRVTGNITALGKSSSRHFGGAGDIRFEGDITDDMRPSLTLKKTGPGTLTLLGTSKHEGPTSVLNGGLVLDYAVTNGNKISATAPLELTGALKVLGSADGDTVANIGQLVLFAREPHNHISIEARGRGGNNAELRMDSISCNNDWMANTVDFIAGEGGAIKAMAAANNPHTGIIRPNSTFNGETFARYSDTPGPDGYYTVEGLDDIEYVQSLDPGTSYEIVDIVGAYTNTIAGDVLALRFNSPGASFHTDVNLALASNASGLANNASGAILVTSNAGSEPIIIDGNGVLNPNDSGRIFVHQYNTNAPLVIKSKIFGFSNGASVVKTGPGELVLTGATNVFQYLRVLCGTLTTDDITDAESYSACGKMNGASIGSGGTLKYTGPGATALSNIRIVGNASIDASGSGPLVFTNATNAIQSGDFGNCNILTLTGSGAGEMRGKLDLKEGGVVKTGAGVWTLSGHNVTNSLFSGAVVEEGTLAVECTLGRNVVVKENGAIAGSGFIMHSLRLAGSLAVDADAVIDGRVLTVDGNIVIDNAQFAVKGRFPHNEPKEILKANGTITGEFANVPVKYRLRYESNSVFLKEIPLGSAIFVR